MTLLPLVTWRVVAALMTLGLAAAAGALAPVRVTEAAWTDRVRATGDLGTGRWAVDGLARGEAVTASLSNVLLVVPVTVGPIGPLQSSTATPSNRGPHSTSVLSLSVPGLSLAGLAGATVEARAVGTDAVYSPTAAEASSSIAGATVGLSLLGAIGDLSGVNALLGDLLEVGVLQTSAACEVGEPSSAYATPIADIELSLLGQDVVLDADGRATVTVSIPLVATVKAVVGVDRVVSTTTAAQDPAAEGSIGLVVTVEVVPLLGILGTVKVSVEVPLVRSVCALDVP